MKKKEFMSTILTLLFPLISYSLFAHSFVLSIEPARIAELPINSTFTVNVNATDFTHLYGYNISVTFDSLVLEATQVNQGPFLRRYGPSIWINPTILPGKVKDAAEACLAPNPGALGSGTFFSITFKVIGKGNSKIHFYTPGIDLSDHFGYVLNYFALLDGWYGSQSSKERGEFIVSSASDLQEVPSAGWITNISKYAVVWQDKRSSNYDIYGQLVNPDGSLSGSNFSICDSIGSQLEPAIAYNPVPAFLNYKFSLVVWTDSRRGADSADIYGRFLLDGTPISGAGFKIAGGLNFQNNPEVANCGSRYLVIWQEVIEDAFRRDTSLIYGQLLSKNGTLIGSKITISPPLSSYKYNYNLQPSMVSGDSAFLIAWSHSENYSVMPESYLKCRIVDTLGNQSSVINITPYAGSGYYYQSSCGFSGSNYLVIWTVGNSLKVIKGQLVSKTGSLIGSNFTIYQTSDSVAQLPEVSFDGSNYLIVWDEKLGNGIDNIKGCFVSTSGGIGSPFVLSSAPYQQTFPSCARGQSSIAVWQDYRNGADYDIWGYLGSPLGIFEPTDFTAVPKKGYVLLKWRTETEKGSCEWLIQRKEKGGEYVTIGRLEAKGNISHPTDYRYEDRDIELGDCYFYRLVGIDINNNSSYYGSLFVDFSTSDYIPGRMFLGQNFPNPFGQITNIRFGIPYGNEDDITRLAIYDVTGRSIRTLFSKKLEPGYYNVIWDGKDNEGREVKKGVYFYRLNMGSMQITKKMLIIR